MDCKNIRQLMHEVLDEPEKMLKESEYIISHCQRCPDCSSMWAELQSIEKGLFDMELEELSVDFSTVDWEKLAQADSEVSKALARDKAAPNWAIVSLAGLVILSLGIWGMLLASGVWGLISQDLIGGLVVNQVTDLIAETAYWILLIGTLLDVGLSLVLINFVQVATIVLACSVLIVYLLKAREKISFNWGDESYE